MSWKPEVIADNSGVWTGNAIRFATKEEALAYLADLCCRWTAVRETRAVECDLPVNYRWADGRAEHIKVDPFEAAIELSQARIAAVLGPEEVAKLEE